MLLGNPTQSSEAPDRVASAAVQLPPRIGDSTLVGAARLALVVLGVLGLAGCGTAEPETAPPASPTPAAPSDPLPEPSTPAPVWPTLAHHLPEAYGLPGDLVLTAELEGGNVDCEPEVLIRPVMPSPIQFTGTAMASAGTSAWSATLRLPEGERWDVGAEYYFRCCLDGSCGAGLRNKANPFRVDKARR